LLTRDQGSLILLVLIGANSVAKSQHLTVRQIAELIRRQNEEMGTVVDRIRGWADFGLLKVSGQKHPGTGKKRLYEPAAIIDSMVMTALTDAGLAAVRVGHFADASGKLVLGHGRMAACEVLNPGKPIGPAFLFISGPTPGPYSIALPNGNTTVDQIVGMPDVPWSIILNLTHYFKPLRGIVSAVVEHGTPKIDLIEGR
jgi:hypothetical protein